MVTKETEEYSDKVESKTTEEVTLLSISLVLNTHLTNTMQFSIGDMLREIHTY